MTALGNGLYDASQHEEALTVDEARLSMLKRSGASEKAVLDAQHNLATSYGELGQVEKALSMERDIYAGSVERLGEDHRDTLSAAGNYATSLIELGHFEEAKSLLRKTTPVARRVLGESVDLTLTIRWNYAQSLSKAPDATLDDLREAVDTFEATERTARRLLGDAHPITTGIEKSLGESRDALRARETSPSPSESS